MVVPQAEVRAGPTGREGGEVMSPWEWMVRGRRERRVVVVGLRSCMVGRTDLRE